MTRVTPSFTSVPVPVVVLIPTPLPLVGVFLTTSVSDVIEHGLCTMILKGRTVRVDEYAAPPKVVVPNATVSVTAIDGVVRSEALNWFAKFSTALAWPEVLVEVVIQDGSPVQE